MSRRRSARWALALLLLLLQSVSHGTDALYFTIPKRDDRCFVVDVPAQTPVRVEYESPDTTDVMKTMLTIYSLDGGLDPLVQESTSHKGSKSFTAQQNGVYYICVSLDLLKYSLPENASMRFTLNVVIGTSQEEYQNLAKKNQMDDLHLKILQLRDRVAAIQRNQDYAKEKSLAMQSSIESNNQRAMWVSLLQIATLLITGLYQAKHLKAYLYKKKLV